MLEEIARERLDWIGPWRLNRLMGRWVRACRVKHAERRGFHYDHHLVVGPAI